MNLTLLKRLILIFLMFFFINCNIQNRFFFILIPKKTESEKDSILEESKSWQLKPTHIQKAVLLAGKITRYEKITL